MNETKGLWTLILLIAAVILGYEVTRSALCLLIIPGAFALLFVMYEIFEEMSIDYFLVVLIVFDIILGVMAVRSMWAEEDEEEARIEHIVENKDNFCPPHVPPASTSLCNYMNIN